MGAMIATLAVLFGARGANVISIKFAQEGRVSTLKQSIVFTTLFSAFQAILLLAVPPYRPLITDLNFIFYPFGFAVFYAIGYIFLLLAISNGSSSITNTIYSFNTIVAVLFGVFLWDEKLSVLKVLGLILFGIGMVLYNKSSYSVGGQKRGMSVKWLIYVIVATLGCGISIIFTKLGMNAYPEYGKEYLLYYSAIATLIGLVVILFYGRQDMVTLAKDGKFMLHTCLAAATLDISNYIFVNYISRFPSIIFLPLYSIIGMLAIIVFSRVILKERISRNAVISTVLCLIAIVLLNF